MASNKRRSGRGAGQRGRPMDQRKGLGAESANWRDHPEPTPPRPQTTSPSHPTLHEKYVEYLSKEWTDVDRQLKAGQVKTFSPGDGWSIDDLPAQPLDLQSWLEKLRTSEADNL